MDELCTLKFIQLKETNITIADIYLHSDNCIDEEEHDNEQSNVWQSLEWLDERPQ